MNEFKWRNIMSEKPALRCLCALRVGNTAIIAEWDGDGWIQEPWYGGENKELNYWQYQQYFPLPLELKEYIQK